MKFFVKAFFYALFGYNSVQELSKKRSAPNDVEHLYHENWCKEVNFFMGRNYLYLHMYCETV